MSEILRSKYYNLYKNRINSSYQEYFEKRYKPLIDVIEEWEDETLKIEGIGIGSLYKGLRNQGSEKMIFGFDNDDGMLDLCRKNNNYISIYHDNILLPRNNPAHDIVATHGVLQHFEDDDIRDIIKRYNKRGKKHIHYIPTDKYLTKTIGDERLLSVQYWLNLVKPTDYILFNDDYDLLLIKE